ncbi:hypothetical protein M8W81_004483 [Salmonella enterica]|nr:hypothetical protein [Salmonella enterica]EJF6006188.1 hypothetical protein [Salmonella enterica]EJF6164522.1 hypothetical protein [Salmonella enterica]
MKKTYADSLFKTFILIALASSIMVPLPYAFADTENNTAFVQLNPEYDKYIDFNTYNGDFNNGWEDLEYGIGDIAINDATITTDNYSNSNTGMASIKKNMVNNSILSTESSYSRDLFAKAGGKLNIPDTHTISGDGNWLLNAGVGEKVTIVPSLIYQKNLNVILNATGMSIYGAIGTNNGIVHVKSSLNANIFSGADFVLTSDNKIPTKEELEKLNYRPVEWKIVPIVNVTTDYYSNVRVIGMQAASLSRDNASAINNGSIFVNGSILSKKEALVNFANPDIKNFTINTTEGPLSVEVDSSHVNADTKMTGTALAVGMFGLSGYHDQLTGESDNYSGVTYLENNGEIKINTTSDFTSSGMAASVEKGGTVIVVNHGDISLSGASGKFKHEFYGQISDNGHLYLGDWIYRPGKADDVVPFALNVDSGATGKLGFTKTATLYIIPVNSKQVDQNFTLGTMFGLYKNNSNLEADLSYVDGQFRRYDTGSNMLKLHVSGSDMNHMTAKINVIPEHALGHKVRYMTYMSSINSLLDEKTVVNPRRKNVASGWQWSVSPWHSNYSSNAVSAFNGWGNGIVIKGTRHSGSLDTTTYFTIGHEALNSSDQLLSSSSKKFSSGISEQIRLNDILNAGWRIDTGRGFTDWTGHDKFGSDKSSTNSTYTYTEINTGAEISFLDNQFIGGGISAGWLRLYQGGLTFNTPGTGTVKYDKEIINTSLLNASSYWSSNFNVGDYTITPYLSLMGTYITNADYKTKFLYFDRVYTGRGEADNFFTTVATGLGLSKGNVSFRLSGSGRYSSHIAGHSMNAELSWRF